MSARRIFQVIFICCTVVALIAAGIASAVNLGYMREAWSGVAGAWAGPAIFLGILALIGWVINS